MLFYLLRRIVLIFVSLIIVLGLAFVLLDAAPGSPFASELRTLEDRVERLEQGQLINKPLHIRWIDYMGKLLTGDWGYSIHYPQRSVQSIVFQHLPLTVFFIAFALFCAYGVGIWLGMFLASFRKAFTDQIVAIWTVLAIAIPFFLFAPLLQTFFGVQWDLLPIAGWSSHRGSERGWILPLITLALPLTAWVTRMSYNHARSLILSPWFRTSLAQGQTVFKALKNDAYRSFLSLLLGWLSPAMGLALTACIIIEPLYGVPGLARYLVEACVRRDYPLILGIVFVFACISLLLNLLADIMQSIVDARMVIATRKPKL